MNSSKNTMDSIKIPDQAKIDSLHDGFNTKKVAQSKSLDDFAAITAPSFDKATKVETPVRSEEKQDDADDFIPKPDPNRRANNIGVKIGKRYIAKTKLAKIIVSCVVAVAVILFFFPPVVTNNTDESGSESRNIFSSMGLSELKEDIYKNKNVYDDGALSSEKSENYRICTIALNISNMTPFELKIPGYSIASADSSYKTRFAYAASVKEGGDIIPPFSNEPVKVEVLVNVADLDERQFDEAVTSLVLKTTGMKKKIGSSTYCPCLPAFVFVSNAVSFQLEAE